jgi:hypothetical protein
MQAMQATEPAGERRTTGRTFLIARDIRQISDTLAPIIARRSGGRTVGARGLDEHVSYRR